MGINSGWLMYWQLFCISLKSSSETLGRWLGQRWTRGFDVIAALKKDTDSAGAYADKIVTMY